MSPMGAADPDALCHRIARIEEVVGREILDQITDQALNQQRGNDGDRYMFGGILRLAPHRGDRFEADQDENRDCGLNEHVAGFMRSNDGHGAEVCVRNVAGRVGLRVGDLEGHWLAGCVEQRQRIAAGVANRRAVFGCLRTDRCRWTALCESYWKPGVPEGWLAR